MVVTHLWPMDCELNAGAQEDNQFLAVITGPNMAGKSTYIRQIALAVVLAQAGSFVPAQEAHIGIVDRLFTRVGAGDELARNMSTFMVEMAETAAILNNATDASLVILDEVGRGTSTYDGVSLAWAITEHIHDHVNCRCLFATHYHELTALEEKLSGVCNLTVSVAEENDNVVFLHRIVNGAATKKLWHTCGANCRRPQYRYQTSQLYSRTFRRTKTRASSARNCRICARAVKQQSDSSIPKQEKN